MRWIRGILTEIWGLFVDDGAYAAAILLWAVVVTLVSRFTPGLRWIGPVFFLGLSIILVESALRFVRNRRR